MSVDGSDTEGEGAPGEIDGCDSLGEGAGAVVVVVPSGIGHIEITESGSCSPVRSPRSTGSTGSTGSGPAVPWSVRAVGARLGNVPPDVSRATDAGGCAAGAATGA